MSPEPRSSRSDYERMWHLLKGVIREHLDDPEVTGSMDRVKIQGYVRGLNTTLEAMAAIEEVAPRA
jgi:hypothetical protein